MLARRLPAPMRVAMHYFAYGSNLSVAAMKARCPAAVPISKATLPDHRLVFRIWADVEPCLGQSVPGVLWTITSACESALDLYEDIAGGLYRRLTVSVKRDGVTGPVLALIYRMNRTGYEPPDRDSLSLIEAGYADFGMDPRWIADAEQRSRS